jgi:hypothetical protein
VADAFYEPRWTDPAIDQLADAYLTARAAGRAAEVTRVVADAEKVLARRPRDVGESRSALFRVLCMPPLVFDYYIVEDDHRIFITGVRYVGPRS